MPFVVNLYLNTTATGESLEKQPIADFRRPGGAGGVGGDGSLAPGSFAFDEKRHVRVNVHSTNPKAAKK